jgi:hypothetical protein
MAYTIDSKIGDFLKDPKSLAVLGQYLQEASKSPNVDMIKGMLIKDIISLPQVKQLGVTEEMVKGGLANIYARLK